MDGIGGRRVVKLDLTAIRSPHPWCLVHRADLVAALGGGEGIVPLDEEVLRGLSLSEEGRRAVDIMLEDQRRLVDEGLEPGMFYALTYTITDLARQGRPIHPDTVDAYNWVLERRG